jgi:protein SCO1/2
MDRRQFLRTVAAGGLFAGVSGCLSGGEGNPNVTLTEPDREYESSTLPYLAWGQRVPDVSIPAPLEDRSLSPRSLSVPSFITFFYSTCPDVCPALVGTLRNIQTHAANDGYSDEVAFLPITFDPENDDATRLREYAGDLHVDADAGNWHFLRPATPERAKTVVREAFGVMFSRQSPTETPAGNETASNRTSTHDGHAHSHSHGDGHAGVEFVHSSVTMLVNADGYVERAYRTKTPDSEQLIADLERLR